MKDPDGGDAVVCHWYVDATEARMTLDAAIKSNPRIKGLHLEHGLGNAFTMCDGWPKGTEGQSGWRRSGTRRGRRPGRRARSASLQANRAFVERGAATALDVGGGRD